MVVDAVAAERAFNLLKYRELVRPSGYFPCKSKAITRPNRELASVIRGQSNGK
jgi:hypothetical protein